MQGGRSCPFVNFPSLVEYSRVRFSATHFAVSFLFFLFLGGWLFCLYSTGIQNPHSKTDLGAQARNQAQLGPPLLRRNLCSLPTPIRTALLHSAFFTAPLPNHDTDPGTLCCRASYSDSFNHSFVAPPLTQVSTALPAAMSYGIG